MFKTELSAADTFVGAPALQNENARYEVTAWCVASAQAISVHWDSIFLSPMDGGTAQVVSASMGYHGCVHLDAYAQVAYGRNTAYFSHAHLLRDSRVHSAA